MIMQLPVAIVGGGPAGALAAAQLAAGGRKVLLFDERLAWEKPCGGGITHKALLRYPFLADAGQRPGSADNRVAHNFVDDCELISPSGKRARFHMQHPVAVFSRLALNGLLLERARGCAGVEIRQERVTRIERAGSGNSRDWKLSTPQHSYHASYVILAAGARNSFRSQFLAPFAPTDLMVTAGYFIPVRSPLMQIQFLRGVTGYIWVFPRADHVSAGIAAKMGEIPAGELRRVLELWLQDNGFKLQGGQFYSHILPSLRAESFESLEVCGAGWAMIGDSAGLVDPITGEGLYYALLSAELCAEALLSEQPELYQTLLQIDELPELNLAARLSERFYRGQIFGQSILERMVSLAARSVSIRDLLGDLFAGTQGYRDLRARLYQILPTVMGQEFAGMFRRSQVAVPIAGPSLRSG